MTVEAIAAVRARVEVSAGDLRFEVQKLTGLERVSSPFRFEVTLSADRGTEEHEETAADRVNLSEMISKPALVELSEDAEDGGILRRIHGSIASFEQRQRSGKNTYYNAVIVPRAYRSHLGKHSRIFQDETTKTIVSKILEEHGLAPDDDFRFQLARDPRPRPYCVQYRESDWSFVNRLLEEEGILYWFVHEETREVMVMADSIQALPPIPGRDTLPFHPVQDAMPPEEHIAHFHFGEAYRAASVFLRDWNFLTPDLANEGLLDAFRDDERNTAGAGIVVYEYPGRYDDVDFGNEALAPIRLEEIQSGRIWGEGESTSARLTAGHLLRIRGHYRSELDAPYALVEVFHDLSVPPAKDLGTGVRSVYNNTFRCTPANLPLRPARTTPKPLVPGVQTALVVGPEGEEIFTDDLGRIKIKFHWDLSTEMEEPTCFVRVAQIWAGQSWGAFFLPRIGQEVVVAFEEGDPDRPLVIGSVYFQSPPYPLPAEKTKSTIKSNSSPGGEGSNELRFEDKKGEEEIFLHAQRNMSEVIEAEHSLSVGGSQSITIKGNQSIIIQGQASGGGGGERGGTVSITGDWRAGATNTIAFQAPTSISMTCGGSSITIEPGKVTLKAGGGASLVLDGNMLGASSAGSKVVLDGNAFAEASGGASLLLDGNAKLSSSGGSEVLLDSNAKMSASANAEVKGVKVAVNGDAEVAIAGAAGSVKADAAGAAVSGPKVDVSGQAMVNITGAMVKLN